MPVCIVVLASTWYHGHQLYDQRIARALSNFGRVLYVEPVRALGREQPALSDDPVAIGDLEVVRPRMLPFGQRRFVQPITAVLVAAQIRWHLRKFRAVNETLQYVVIASPAGTLRALPKGPNVHIIKDDYVAGSGLIGIDPQLLLKRFYAKIRYAQHVTTVSPFLQQVLLARGVRSTVVPAGCDILRAEHPCPAEFHGQSPPRAVFIGMISDRIDFVLIERIIDAGISVVFVGPVQNTFTKQDEFAALKAREGFLLLTPRTGSALEAVLQHCQIGLIPYVQSDFNRSSFPLKAFEYLAAGLPIVSTPLPAMSWLNYDVIQIRSDRDDFVDAVVSASNYNADVAERCKEIAAANSWDSRAQVYASILGLTA